MSVERAGAGLVLVLVLAIALVLAVILGGQRYFASGVGEQVRRSLAAEEARVVAEAAVEAAFARITAEANGAQGPEVELFRKFRAPDPKPFPIAVDVESLEAYRNAVAFLPVERRPHPVLDARVRFQYPFDRDGVPAHDERYGTLQVSATVPYAVDRAEVHRNVTRWFEFRVVRPALPFPFDLTPLYLGDCRVFADRNTRLAQDKPDSVNALLTVAAGLVATTLEVLLDRQSELRHAQAYMSGLNSATFPGAPQAAAAYGNLAATLGAPVAKLQSEDDRHKEALDDLRNEIASTKIPHLFTYPLYLQYRVPGHAPASASLDDVNLPAKAKQLARDLAGADDKVQQALGDLMQAQADLDTHIDTPGDGSYPATFEAKGAAFAQATQAATDAAVKVLDFYERIQTEMVQVSGTPAEGNPLPGLEVLLGLPEWATAPAPGGNGTLQPPKAQWTIPAASLPADDLARAVDDLLDRYGPPLQGILHVDNAAGPPLVLDGGRDARFRRFAGRLVVVTSGACTVQNVGREDPAQHLLTVIAHGPLTIAGTIEASLVAAKSLVRAGNPPADVTLTGNLVLLGPVFTAPDLEPLLAGIQLKVDRRAAATDENDMPDPAHSSVLFSPVPVYERSPRQEPK